MKIPLSFRIMRAVLKPLSHVAPSLVGHFWAIQFMTPTRHKRPEWEEKILIDAQPLTLQSKIKAWSWGEGPTVLLVHGWDGRGSQLGTFVRPLVEKGFRVVAFDGPAHGDSPGKWTNLGLYAKAMISLTDELTEKFGPIHSVIAHSFGAGATSLAITLGMRVNRVVLIASPSAIQGVFDRFTHFIGISKKSAEVLQSTIETSAGLSAKEIHVAHLTDRMREPVEALLFHDPKDREVPFDESVAIAQNWKHAKLIPVNHGGHRRILKNPDVVEETVKFIARTAG